MKAKDYSCYSFQEDYRGKAEEVEVFDVVSKVIESCQ